MLRSEHDDDVDGRIRVESGTGLDQFGHLNFQPGRAAKAGMVRRRGDNRSSTGSAHTTDATGSTATIGPVTRLYLQGALVTGARHGIVALDDPSTGEPVARIHTAAGSQLRAAAAGARTSLIEGRWARMPAAYRVGVLRTMLSWIETSAEQLVARDVAETGTPVRGARAELARALADAAEILDQPASLVPRVHAVVGGTPGDVQSWLSIAIMTLRDGGAIILAPLPRVRAYATMVAEAADGAGCMPGVVHSLPAANPRELCGSPLIDQITFLGVARDAAGHARAAATHATPLRVRDLSVVVVASEDADPEEVAASLARRFDPTTGPFGAATTAIVRTDLVERVADALASRAITARLGVAADENTDVGPVASPEVLAQTLANIGEVSRRGGALLCGGTLASGDGLPREGRYLTPTVVIDPEARPSSGVPVTSIVPAASVTACIETLASMRPAFVTAFGSLDPVDITIAMGRPHSDNPRRT